MSQLNAFICTAGTFMPPTALSGMLLQLKLSSVVGGCSRWLRCALWLACCCAVLIAPAVWAADDFLPPEQAFRFAVRAIDAGQVEVSFEVAPGYYLYHEQFRFAATGAMAGTPQFPPGKVKFDETFQKNVETHRDLVRI